MAKEGLAAASSDDAKQHTSLLDLPPEIWSKIGKLIIDQAQTITNVNLYHTENTDISERNAARVMVQQPAITRTCKILRAELLRYYYRHKVDVHVVPRGMSAPPVGRWLRAIGYQNMRFISGFWGCDDGPGARVAQSIREGFDVEFQVPFELGEVERFVGEPRPRSLGRDGRFGIQAWNPEGRGWMRVKFV